MACGVCIAQRLCRGTVRYHFGRQRTGRLFDRQMHRQSRGSSAMHHGSRKRPFDQRLRNQRPRSIVHRKPVNIRR